MSDGSEAPPPLVADPAGPGTVLLVRLRDETCAFSVSVVVEVFPLERWTPVPGTPPFVVGVVGRRGAAYPVLDVGLLRSALRGEHWAARAPEPLGSRGSALLLRTPSGGLVVTAVDVEGLAQVEPVAGADDPTLDPLAPRLVSDGRLTYRLYDPTRLETVGRAELRAVALSARP